MVTAASPSGMVRTSRVALAGTTRRSAGEHGAILRHDCPAVTSQSAGTLTHVSIPRSPVRRVASPRSPRPLLRREPGEGTGTGWRRHDRATSPRTCRVDRYARGMCGIVGYIGDKPALDVILDGLRRLEYRGYDSAGVALLADGGVATRKRAGKLANLVESIEADPLPSTTVGMGHTLSDAWRPPNDRNASAPRRDGWGCRHPQRDHRELRHAASGAVGRGGGVPQRHRYRGGRAPAGDGAARCRGRPGRGDAPSLSAPRGAFPPGRGRQR